MSKTVTAGGQFPDSRQTARESRSHVHKYTSDADCQSTAPAVTFSTTRYHCPLAEYQCIVLGYRGRYV